MDITPTITLVELVWTIACALVLFRSLRMLRSRWLDRRAATTERLLRVAKANLRTALARCYRLIFYLGIGMYQMRVPTPRRTESALADLIVGLGFIFLALNDAYTGERDARLQARLDADIALRLQIAADRRAAGRAAPPGDEQ